MKMYKEKCWSVVIVFILLVFIGCKDDEGGSESQNSFTIVSDDIDVTLDKVTIPVKLGGNEYHLSVTSPETVVWEAKVIEGGDFISVNPVGDQKGNGEITITVTPNGTSAERSGKISISSTDGKSKSIVFEQEATIDKTFSFAVMGDLHFGRGKDPETKIPQGLKVLQRVQPNLKALFLCGDFTDSGTAAHYKGATELISSNVSSNIPVYYMMGNHDTYEAKSIDWYEQYVGQPVYQYIEKNGYPFITISVKPTGSGSADYTTEAIDFLKAKLELAKKDYPGKPIFVFSHSPSKRSPWGERWGYSTMDDVLKAYPQVVHFTGHTHFTIQDERSVWQKEYTWMNVGPSNYANIQEAITGYHYPASGIKVTEALVVEIQQNMDVKVTRLDTYNDLTIKESQPWVIEAPHNGTKFKYTDARTGGATPQMTSETPTIADVTETGCKVTFKQGTDDDLIYHYEIEAVKTGTEEVAFAKKEFSHFYLRKSLDEIATLDCMISGLSPNTSYTIRVKGVDSFYGKSDWSVSQAFTTKVMPPIDPNTPAPKADLIDVVFGENYTAKNVANSSLTVLPTESKGAATVYNSDLKLYVSQYVNTSTDVYKLDYSKSNFISKVKEGYTFEVYCKTTKKGVMQYAFSNLQSAGMGLAFYEVYTAPTSKNRFAMMHHNGTSYVKTEFIDEINGDDPTNSTLPE